MDAPIYCRNCHSFNTWQRNDKQDVLTDSGNIYELCYQCDVCQSKTWVRNK